jgi:glycosyltransferase involved in cell wall biosynthesis
MRNILHYMGSVTGQAYKAILRQAHIGLCLKLPARSMGETTFPSKVVELSSQGLHVISTRVSDVPLLFDETTATLLHEATPRSLAHALVTIVRNGCEANTIALNGQNRITSLLSAEKVGFELLRFWSGGSPDQGRGTVRSTSMRE